MMLCTETETFYNKICPYIIKIINFSCFLGFTGMDLSYSARKWNFSKKGSWFCQFCLKIYEIDENTNFAWKRMTRCEQHNQWTVLLFILWKWLKFIQDNLTSINSRVEENLSTNNSILQTLGELETRISGMEYIDKLFGWMDLRIDRVETHFSRLENIIEDILGSLWIKKGETNPILPVSLKKE